MDIAAMSVVLNQAQLKQQAGVSVMKSLMSTAEQNGQALIEMMNPSNAPDIQHPHLGSTIDRRA